MDFIGNKKTADLLARGLKNSALNHAYLFSGPESVGKFTLAKMFAQNAIAGGELELDADQVNKEALLDLIVVEPEVVEKKGIAKQRDISIETIREAKQNLSLFPYHGKYKVLIINDAHRLNASAQNALLKILEEPNPTTIIILVTHEIDRILQTILSRCQVVNFTLVGEEELIAAGFAQEDAELAIGRPGLLRKISQDLQEKEFRLAAKMELTKLVKGSLNERFALAEEFSKDIVMTLKKLNIWLWEIRKNASGDMVQKQKVYEVMEKIQITINVLKRSNANSRLILETLFMDI